jgi:hypothetical protein
VPPRRQVNPPRWSEERPAPARQLFDGSDHPDSDSLQRHWSQARSIDSASTPSTPQEAASDAALRRLQSLLIRCGGAPDVHLSLFAGGGQGSIPAVWRSEDQPPCSWGSAAPRRRGGGSKWDSPRVGGLQACSPRAGLIRPPGEEVPGVLQDVSFRPWSLHRELFNLALFVNLRSIFS